MNKNNLVGNDATVNDTTNFHLNEKQDKEMIDEVTLQHCLRFPNSFLKSGLSYREILAKKFLPLIEKSAL